MLKTKQIKIRNESGITLKVTVISEQNRYQTQKKEQNIRNGNSGTVFIPVEFTRLILSKD